MNRNLRIEPIRLSKGSVCFVSGRGFSAERKPNYETAFIFIDDEYNNPAVPPWAIKLVLQWDEI